MREVVPVLAQLLTDPLLIDRLALELYVEDAYAVSGDLEQVKLFRDMRDRV